MVRSDYALEGERGRGKADGWVLNAVCVNYSNANKSIEMSNGEIAGGESLLLLCTSGDERLLINVRPRPHLPTFTCPPAPSFTLTPTRSPLVNHTKQPTSPRPSPPAPSPSASQRSYPASVVCSQPLRPSSPSSFLLLLWRVLVWLILD